MLSRQPFVQWADGVGAGGRTSNASFGSGYLDGNAYQHTNRHTDRDSNVYKHTNWHGDAFSYTDTEPYKYASPH